jgi:prevent-host-death family protein
MTDLLSVSDAKRHLGAVVDRAHLAHEPVSLSKRGRRVAVVVDADEFDRLRELAEDAEDAAAAAAARQEIEETGALPVPWEEVKAELGLS